MPGAVPTSAALAVLTLVASAAALAWTGVPPLAAAQTLDEVRPTPSGRAVEVWLIGSTLVIGGLLACVYLLPAWLMRVVRRLAHPSVLFCASTDAPVCALTIDDAPSASTPLLLDILREHQVRATFFIISGNIADREDVVRRIVDEGHALGNHLTEDRPSILDDLHVFEAKLQECEAAINKFQPVSAASSPSDRYAKAPGESERLLAADGSAGATKWMRPASGWFTAPMRKIAESHGYRICLGSVYPHDAQIRSETLNSLYLRSRTRSGSVIIVHDRSWTVGVLRTALPELARKFTFVSLDDLAARHQEE